MRPFVNRIIKHEHFLPVIVILAVCAGYYWPQITGHAIPFAADMAGSDLLGVHFPYFAHSAEMLHRGELPLWTSRIGGGYPQMAEPNLPFFYPVTIVLFALLPPVKAFIAAFPLHAAMASLLMYWYARAIGIGRWGAMLAGITFAFNGYFVGHLKHLTYFIAASLLPGVLLCAHRFPRTRKQWWGICAGIVLTLMLYAGSVQIVYQTILLLALMCGGQMLFDIYSHAVAARARREKIKKVFSSLGAWGAFGLSSAFTFLALSAVKLLPAGELIGESSRDALKTLAGATEFPFHPRNLITFIAPFFYGNPSYLSYAYTWEKISQEMGIFWENIGYAGLIPLLLFFAALPLAVVRRSRSMALWILTAIVGLALVFGKYLPFYPWLWEHLPLFSSFRVPGRYLLWVVTALAVLAGYSFDAFIMKLKTLSKRTLSPWIIACLGAGALAVTVFDLGIFNYYYNSMDDLTAAQWEVPPAAVAFLRMHPGYRSVSLFSGQDFELSMREAGGWHGDPTWLLDNRELIPPDYSLLYPIESFDHYAPLSLLRQDSYRTAAYSTLLSSAVYRAGDTLPLLTLHDQAISLLARANVRYILSYANLKGAGIQEVISMSSPHSSRRIRMYEITSAYPRAYLAHSLIAVGDIKASKAQLSALDSGAPTSLIETNDPLPTVHATGTLTVLSSRDGAYRVRTASLDPAFLVFNESWYPGWEARIDGVNAKIFPVNLSFQGIVIPEGIHEIVFAFRSSTFLMGAYISGAAWAALLLALLWHLLRRKTKQGPSMLPA